MDVPTWRILVFSAPGETDLANLGHHSARVSVAKPFEDGAGLNHSETDSMDDQSDESSSEDNEHEARNDCSLLAPLIEAHTVYELTTYDLREDLLSLGLAEVSGRIALGTRFGQIRMI
ncbi:hypothetical protein HETIRDRAFT_478643 [Heterobasidion irregulare TC 32-1]|uniref:Uncharacterized protein n=1 Tax=Heterobasidion irregulare (strain TC 32-1) TaxID=747525 RepID=W4K2B4_HETIT|nr:uncharacterized protein HETIRDRAFT_478643 [Heterobasidion irregulare TC 32-1]ETW79231.1 hypothetical protein HETIRDRAFT_478643 [Heterobasidion irregulare TC 32-1]